LFPIYVKLIFFVVNALTKIKRLMSKLDEIKEILNTLRVAMSISFGILVVTITGLVKRLDVDNVDTLFWTGIVFSILVIIVILKLFIKISDKTKQIGGL